MKQLRRALSLLLVVCMMVGLFVIAPLSANAAQTDFPDTANSKYKAAIQLDASLGLMNGYEDGTFRPNGNLTRAEFATIMVRIMGLENIQSGIEYVFFEDVLEEYWAAEAISTIFTMGLVNGYGDGNFGPEDPVLYQDAVKVMVGALGYEHFAKQYGGYPDGYMYVAGQIGLLKSINAINNQPLSREALAQLAYNALTVPQMEQSFSGDYVTYSKGDEGSTYLVKTFDAIKSTGLLTANDRMSLYGDTTLSDGYVRIDTAVYKVGDTNAADYVGYNVTFYYTTDDNDDYKLLMCIPKESANNVIKIMSEDMVDDGTTELSNGTVKYTVNQETGKTTTVKLARAPRLIYNGKAISYGSANYIKKYIMPKNGSTQLIDTDRDNIYDVIIVRDYVSGIVSSADKTKKKIYLKEKAPIDLSDVSSDFSYSIKKDGANVEINALKEWNVVSVATSLDGKNVDILVSTDTVTGDVEEVINENGHIKYMINDEIYSLVADYMGDDITAKTSGTFYLDIDGRIVGFDGTTGGGAVRYVYLMAADNQSNSLERDVSIKVCSTSGSFSEYKLADKVKYTGYLNGAWVNEQKVYSDDLYNGALVTNGNINDQLLVIDTNEDNEIREIQTACSIDDKTIGPDGKPVYDEDKFSMDASKDKFGRTDAKDAGRSTTPASRSTIGTEAVMSESAPIFQVYRVAEGQTLIDETKIQIRTRRQLDTSDKVMKLYDMSSGGSVAVAVYELADSAGAGASTEFSASFPFRMGSSTKMMMVNKVVSALDEDGNAVTKIVGLINGQAGEVIPYEKVGKYTGVGTFNAPFDLKARATAAGVDVSKAENPDLAALEFLMPGDIFWFEANTDGLMTVYQPCIGRVEYKKNADGSDDPTTLVEYNPNGSTKGMTQGVIAKTPDEGGQSGYDWYGASLVLSGTVYDKDMSTNSFKFTSLFKGKEYILANYANGFIVIYDVESETFKAGTLADVVTQKQAAEYANKVVGQHEYSDPSWLVFYQ